MWYLNQISNGANTSKSYSTKNVYELRLVNETSFTITIQERLIGTIVIPAKSSFNFKAHPDYPVEIIKLEVSFSLGAPQTDFLTIITTTCYGINTEKC